MLDELRKMSAGELAETYFKSGGEILPDGSISIPDVEKKKRARLAFEILARNTEGMIILAGFSHAYLRGEVDCFGNPTTATQ